eukprot:753625-Hanusia_phi.AAC.5
MKEERLKKDEQLLKWVKNQKRSVLRLPRVVPARYSLEHDSLTAASSVSTSSERDKLESLGVNVRNRSGKERLFPKWSVDVPGSALLPDRRTVKYDNGEQALEKSGIITDSVAGEVPVDWKGWASTIGELSLFLHMRRTPTLKGPGSRSFQTPISV